jgi:hypothetical protein
MVRRGRLREGLDAIELVTQLMRGGHARGSASQLLSNIEAGGGDRGFWLKLSRTSLARSSQLRRDRSGESSEKGQDSRQKGRMHMKSEHRALRDGGCWVVRKGRRRERSERWRDATFLYPAKAAAGPCARLARCGGRGFRMRACRLVVY